MKNKSIIGLLILGVVIVIFALSYENKASVTAIERPTTAVASNNGMDTGHTETETETNTNSEVHPVTIVQPDDYINGDPNAPITWIEFGDFDCPFCKKLHPELEKMVKEYDGEVKWVFRHFPLPSHGQIAFQKSHASECVGELAGNDAFWDFNGELYQQANSIKNVSGLKSLAGDFGVDEGDFQSCMDSGRYDDKIESQISLASSAGIRGTPGGIVVDAEGNAFLVGGALSFSQMQEILDDLTSEL